MRECLAAIPDTPVSGKHAARELTGLAARRGFTREKIADSAGDCNTAWPASALGYQPQRHVQAAWRTAFDVNPTFPDQRFEAIYSHAPKATVSGAGNAWPLALLKGSLVANPVNLTRLPWAYAAVPCNHAPKPLALELDKSRRDAMKVVILAGGLGTRLGEETGTRPKPMVEIGGKPVLWHIIKYYSTFGLNDFIVCLGYKGYVVKEYFSNYFLHTSDVTIDLRNNTTEIHNVTAEPWRITLVETGETTMTGGRLRRVRQYLDDGPFCMTYGDGVSDVDLHALIAFHKAHKRLATVTAVSPAARFGAMVTEGDSVLRFDEKPNDHNDYINGGFFVLEPGVLDLIDDDSTIWERKPLESLSKSGDLMAFKHLGFWQPMDMLRDKLLLEDLWSKGAAPWRRW